MNEILRRAQGAVVHHFQSRGNDATADDGSHRFACLFHGVEGGQHDPCRGRQRQQLDGDFGDDAQQSLGTREQGQQVVARTVQGAAADIEQLPFRGDQPQAKDVVHREAVLEAVHAAGVLCHIAPNGTGDL